MSMINARTKSVHQLLNNVKYSIDFYQREYEWGRRNIEELLDDFEGKFLASYDEKHERTEVQRYSHYFLGTVITISEKGLRYIVDGQQRLTTLSLLLIYLQHLGHNGNTGIADVSPMIFSTKFGRKSFNINVPERVDCMRALYDNNEFDATDHPDRSVQNLVDRYADIQELFPTSLKDDTLPYFVDWLIENVDLVEIEAYSDDDAFTIFETMNDRGVNLKAADMLKGYLLAHIDDVDEDATHQRKSNANSKWKQRINELITIESGEEDSFFKTWLRAKYAQSMREGKKDAKNRDFENINQFHRWVPVVKDRLGLETSQDYYDFVTRRIHRFAGHYLLLRRASQDLTPGYEEIYYNAHNNFTLQYMLALAPLRLEDDAETVREKIRLVATFIDIYVARRMVNFRVIGYSTVRYTMFNLAKTIRGANIGLLREHLLAFLERMGDTFEGITGDHFEPFALTRMNSRRIHYLLTRMTLYIEQGSGKNTTFRHCAYDGRGKPMEIEHIWADKHERHTDEFPHPHDFQRQRNFIGGLVLLPPGANKSFGADPYEKKVEHYLSHNLLAASLYDDAYKNNPDFTNFIVRSGLPIKAHTQFKMADLWERQNLYRRICEQIWDTERLNA